MPYSLSKLNQGPCIKNSNSSYCNSIILYMKGILSRTRKTTQQEQTLKFNKYSLILQHNNVYLWPWWQVAVMYCTLQLFQLHCILEFVWKAYLLFTLWVNKAFLVHWMTKKTMMATCHEQSLLALTGWQIGMHEFNFMEIMIRHHSHFLELLLHVFFYSSWDFNISRALSCKGMLLKPKQLSFPFDLSTWTWHIS